MSDSLVDQKTKYKLTWAAIISAIILIVPGFIIGGVVAILYKWSLGHFIGIGGDHWFFFMEWIDKAILLWFPALIHGAVGGVFAITITGKIFKSANLKIVSYSASLVYISMVVMTAFYYHFAIFNEVNADLISVIAETVGIVLGLFYFRVFGR